MTEDEIAALCGGERAARRLSKTELHLDADEWTAILIALRLEHRRTDGKYQDYIEAIILKIECALEP